MKAVWKVDEGGSPGAHESRPYLSSPSQGFFSFFLASPPVSSFILVPARSNENQQVRK